MKKSIIALLALGAMVTSCHNGEKEFPDYVYQTIYFARQTPVRTITLGDDGDYNTDLDNLHQFEIKAVIGGVNTNKKERRAEYVIDNAMVEGLTFGNGTEVKAMPASYYTLIEDKIVIKKGEVLGGLKVQLTDAYFADPASVKATYVIPVVLTSGTDSILQGKPKDGITNPNRLRAADWATLPQDYVLYAVKYKNPYHGVWLSKGTDQVTNAGQASTVNRQTDLWEKASLRQLSTVSLTKSLYSFSHDVTVTNADGSKGEKKLTCELIVNIDDNGNATVTTETPGCTATGSGKWEYKAEKKAWGDKDRDRLTLNYEYAIEYTVDEQAGTKAVYKVATSETMVMRDRQNKLEEFTFTLK